MNVAALADDQALCPPPSLMNASMPQRQESAALGGGGGSHDAKDLRPPSLMNASMPQRQESEDPERIRSMLAGRGTTKRSLLDSDDSICSDEEDHRRVHDEFCWPSSLLLLPRVNATMPQRQASEDPGLMSPPPSWTNATQPIRQESEDPEMVMAMLMSLKDLGK